jgi:uncharacterized membrane protein
MPGERVRRARHGGLTEKDSDRVGALTDGTVAIALTVLVLALPVPDVGGGPAELWAGLRQHGRDYVTFLFAFWLIAVYWLAHRQEFRRVRIATPRVVWANFLYLAAVVLIPFSSQVLSGHGGNALAVTIFASNLVLVSVSLMLIALSARRDEALTAEGREQWLESFVRSCVLVAVNLVVIAVSWIDASAAEFAFLLMFTNDPGTRAIVRRLPAARPDEHRPDEHRPDDAAPPVDRPPGVS